MLDSSAIGGASSAPDGLGLCVSVVFLVVFCARADTQTPLYFLSRGDDVQLSLVGRTQARGLSAAGMSLVCWDFTLYDNRVAVVSCAPPPVAVTV